MCRLGLSTGFRDKALEIVSVLYNPIIPAGVVVPPADPSGAAVALIVMAIRQRSASAFHGSARTFRPIVAGDPVVRGESSAGGMLGRRRSRAGDDGKVRVRQAASGRAASDGWPSIWCRWPNRLRHRCFKPWASRPQKFGGTAAGGVGPARGRRLMLRFFILLRRAVNGMA